MSWIRVEDTIFDHPAFIDDSERMTWLWLIHRAAFKPHRVRYRGRQISLQVGQVAMTVRDLAKHRGWSRSKAYRFLMRLRSDMMIGTYSATGVNVITICNYSKYQSAGDISGTQNRTVAGHKRDGERTTTPLYKVKGVSARAREEDKPEKKIRDDVSRETIQAMQDIADMWEHWRGGFDLADPEFYELVASVERHGRDKLLRVIHDARASPALNGEGTYLRGRGMPLKWLWDDKRIAEVLRGEHGGKGEKHERSRYEQFLRGDSIQGEDGDAGRPEPGRNLRIVEGGRGSGVE